MIEPLRALSELLTFTDCENRYNGECWRCSQPVKARTGSLYRDHNDWILLCSRCARLAARIRTHSTSRRVNTRVQIPERG